MTFRKSKTSTANRSATNNAEVPQTSDLPELQIFQALLAFDGREVLYPAELNFQRPYLIKVPDVTQIIVLIDLNVSLSRAARLDSTSMPRCCPSRYSLVSE
jgi:hypothetical protein